MTYNALILKHIMGNSCLHLLHVLYIEKNGSPKQGVIDFAICIDSKRPPDHNINHHMQLEVDRSLNPLEDNHH